MAPQSRAGAKILGLSHLFVNRQFRAARCARQFVKNLLAFASALCYCLFAVVVLVKPFGYVLKGCKLRRLRLFLLYG
jgi:hypothetical protein